MRKGTWFWLAAMIITLLSAVWQRMSGPTYPVRGKVSLAGTEISYRLDRSHGGAGGQPVRIQATDPEVHGDVMWRRYPSNDSWQPLELLRRGDWLEAALPHQPPAAKIEYQVRLTHGGESAIVPPRPAITRFKGDVAPWLLVPHIAAIFLAMLFSTRAGLEALVPGSDPRRLAWITMTLLVLGGFVFGPAVQKTAFGAWWTGVPYGWDLTDNKILIAGLTWLWAVWCTRGAHPARKEILLAAIATLAVFAIPHSTWGSQLDWQAVPKQTP